ncbi:MAG: ATP-binding cassette domain-containing protein [Schleiferiaceae bacterium]|jgi:ABC-2 type transport system ATP-binding protein|nr:ATP-binding cassette domain-containing protein [Schleiferiaceae bacterium]
MNILEARNITKTYDGHTALNDLSIEIPKGSVYGLLGPNGAGKTSFIRIINQITAPDSGSILLNGSPITREDIYHIGYLPEERGLYKKMKVGEQAMYLAMLKGLSANEAKAKLKEWFVKFEIQDWWNKKVEELSKGMAQKIQFIVTVVHDPKLLIFDEPFSGFDPINTELIKQEIKNLNDNGATIIFSTHRMESVEEICNHIALINNSKKVLEGSVAEIKSQYRTHTFKIAIHNPSSNIALSEHFSLTDQLETEYGKELTIKINDGVSPNVLLQEASKIGDIYHMEEVIPSVNDIFIKTVESVE